MIEINTVETWANEWFLIQIEGQRAVNTQNGYRNLIYRHIIPILGKIPLSQLTANRIRSFYARLSEEGLSQSSVWCIHLLLRQILNAACREGLVDVNPVSTVTMTPNAEKKQIWISTRQLTRYLEATKKWGAYPIFYTGLSSGLRQGELISLTWAAFDLQEKQLLLPHRWVKLSEPLAEILIQEYQHSSKHTNIFLDAKTGTPYTVQRLYYLHRLAQEEAHLPKMGFRDLQKHVREEHKL